MIEICLFMLGTIAESFTETVAYRKIRQENYITGRSHCEHCDHQLSGFDLLPIVGYVLLKGRCRYCHQKISWIHPLLEVAGGCLTVGCYWRYGMTLEMMVIVLICFDLFMISYIDSVTQYIYGSELLAFFIGSLFIRINQGFYWLDLIFAGTVSMAMGLMNLLIHDSFGSGDIAVMLIAGLLLGGKQNIMAMMIAVLLAGFYCGWLLFCRRASRHDHIAFGPFMASGIIMTLFFGQYFMVWWNAL